jgi:hypothetical protein
LPATVLNIIIMVIYGIQAFIYDIQGALGWTGFSLYMILMYVYLTSIYLETVTYVAMFSTFK